MRFTSTNTHARKMLFAAIPSICALSSKKISVYNEEIIVARCFIGFIILSRKSVGNTFKVTLDGKIQAIQEESQQKRKRRALFLKFTFFFMLVVLFFLFSWWTQEWEFFGMVSTRVGRALFIKGVSSLLPEVWISYGACFVASALGGALISCMEGGVPLLAGTSGAGSSGGSGGGSTVGGSSRGWTSFDLDVLAEPFPNEEGAEVAQPHPQNAPANPVASRGEEAGPSNRVPPEEKFPFQPDEIIGGDSVHSIERRLLSKFGSPTGEDIYFAHIRAQDLFEAKVEIVRHMAGLDPEGDWLGRGARALDNPRTATGEPSVERLYTLLEDLTRSGVQSETFSSLKNKVASKRGEVRDDNSMS